MSDYRIQKQIQLASKNCREILGALYDKRQSFSRKKMIGEIMANYAITQNATERIVDLYADNFVLNGDLYEPKEES